MQAGGMASTSQGCHSPLWRQHWRLHMVLCGVSDVPSKPWPTLGFCANCLLPQKRTLLIPIISGFADWHDLSCRVIFSCGYPLENLGSIALASFFPDHSVLLDSYSSHVPHCPDHARTPYRGFCSIDHAALIQRHGSNAMDPWLLSTPPEKLAIVKGSAMPNT